MAKRNRRSDGEPGKDGRRPGAHIEDVPLAEAARSRYLNYALSVITSRALPDLRDGLKPVQRRILYAMWHDLHVTADGRYIKCAAVVGEVMKTYHPHGDQSIYDALVRMAQPFRLRQTLVDGYGNFGSIDGDPPAAMRYTECRLTPIAQTLLSELREQTVDYRPNYASTAEEPIVLPAQFPNLLVNGVSGIAVGMATNIPPHNLKEVINALLALLDNRELTLERLLKSIHGPDFPTGGVILNSAEEIRQIYATGQGTIKLRGTYEPHPDRPNAVLITSIPYGIEKDALVERIGELIAKGQVPQLTNVKDLSTDDIRILLELRSGANADAALAYLYKNTPLQINYSINLTCLLPAEGAEVAVPARLDLKTILQQFLDFRLEIVTRRLQFELKNLLARIHILEGFAIVFKNLDEAIKIIRNSDGKADAAPKLIARFELSELQADAVLETKLYRLGKLEIRDILEELAAEAEASQGNPATARRRAGPLADHPGRAQADRPDLWRAAADPDRGARRPRSSSARKTTSSMKTAWVIVTRDGWTKRQKSFTDVASIRVRDDDRVGWVYRARARQTLTFFTDRGIAYTMRVNDIPMTTGHGEPIQKQFAFEDQEHIVGVICHDPRCLPDWTKHPQTPPRLVQRLLGGDLEPADDADSRSDHHHEPGEGNGNGAVAEPAAAAVRDRLDRGRQGAPVRAGAPRRGLDAQGPPGRPARSVVQGRPGRRSRGDRRIGKRLPGHPGGPGAHLPGHRGQRRRRGGPRRQRDPARRQGPRHRLRSGQQETRGPDRADQPRGHADRAGHQVSGHRRAAARATRSSSAARSTPSSPPRPSRSRRSKRSASCRPTVTARGTIGTGMVRQAVMAVIRVRLVSVVMIRYYE